MKKITIILLSFMTFIIFAKTNDKKVCEIAPVQEKQELILKDLNQEKLLEKELVVYTAIWCPHCQKQYPKIQEAYDRYGENFEYTVIVSGDRTKEEVINYFKSKGYNFPIHYDNGGIFANQAGIRYLPTFLKVGGSKLTILDISHLDFDQYVEMFSQKNDIKMRKLLKGEKIIKQDNKEVLIDDILKGNQILVYGAPWCSDTNNEMKRLKKIAGNRKIVYLVDPAKYSLKEFINYKIEGNIEIYYVKNMKLKEKLGITWLPSTTEVRKGKIIGNFISNQKYLIK